MTPALSTAPGSPSDPSRRDRPDRPMAAPAPAPVPDLPRDLEGLFAALASSPRPALVRYAAGGERIELSGKVLENWIAKTANLWTEELDARPENTIRLPAEVHWRTVAIGLAALRTGLRLVPSDAEFWVGFEDCEEARTAEAALFVARPGLASRWPGDASAWPADAVDYAAEVRSFDDVFVPLDPVPADTPVGQDENGPITVTDWTDRVAAAAREDFPESARAVLPAHAAQDAPGLARILGLALAGRAVVLIDAETAADPEAVARILEQEQAVRG